MLSILSFILKKENQKLLIFLAIGVFVAAFVQTCNQNQKLQEQVQFERQEQVRILHNWEASLDTIKQHRDKEGTLKGEISGYQLTQKELLEKYSEIFTSVEKFKEEWEKTPPKTIVETKYIVTEKIRDFNVSVNQDGQRGNIKFDYDTSFSSGNSRKIKGNLKYDLSYFSKKDSNYVKFLESPYYAKVNPFSTEMTLEQVMSLNTGLTRDPVTGKVKIWATTDYPGVTFGELKGADITSDKELMNLMGKPRRSWGLGFSLGPGLMYNPVSKNITPGFYIGMGLNYTSKKLQF
jgi:hypothetical protein